MPQATRFVSLTRHRTDPPVHRNSFSFKLGFFGSDLCVHFASELTLQSCFCFSQQTFILLTNRQLIWILSNVYTQQKLSRGDHLTFDRLLSTYDCLSGAVTQSFNLRTENAWGLEFEFYACYNETNLARKTRGNHLINPNS